MNIHDTKYKIRFSYIVIGIYTISVSAVTILFCTGVVNNIARQSYGLALVCGLFALVVFWAFIRGLRQGVVTLLFTDEGVLIRRPFEKIAIFKRKPQREFIPRDRNQTASDQTWLQKFCAIYLRKEQWARL